jgi:hypothetical protein
MCDFWWGETPGEPKNIYLITAREDARPTDCYYAPKYF